MIIRKAFKFRLYPTEDQAAALRQHGGNTRFLYNLLLERHDRMHADDGRLWKRNEMITAIPKIKEEFPFLKDSFSQSLQQVAIQLDKAFTKFFERGAKHPVFKSKHQNNDSFTVPQKWGVDRKFVFLPKIGEVSWKKHRHIEGTPKHLSVTQDGDRWFCSVNCEVEIQDPVVPDGLFVGIDLGLKNFAVLSDGTVIENPRHLQKMEEKLRREQRRLSRKAKGSKNREKQKKRCQAVHRRVRDSRKDFLHKITHNLVKNYDGFAVESLNISGMLKNHRLAKSISDAGWGEFGRQLSYKSEWNGNTIVEIGRFFPSSKMCSTCGWIKDDLTLSDRMWACGRCDATHDRDLNASINIEAEGLSSQYAATTAGLAGSDACGEEGSGQRYTAGETILVEAGKIRLASGRSAKRVVHAVR